MTYLTLDKASTSPIITENNVLDCACKLFRSKAFKSLNLPRFRSYPIHNFSCAFQRRGLCNNKKGAILLPALEVLYLSLSPTIALLACVISPSSEGAIS